MRVFIVLVFVLASFCTATVAADWTQYSELDDGTRYYFNIDNEENYSDFKRVWIRAIYSTPGKDGDMGHDTQIDLRKEVPNYRLYYTVPRGGVVSPFFYEDIDAFRWYPIVPDTHLQKLWKIVIENQKVRGPTARP